MLRIGVSIAVSLTLFAGCGDGKVPVAKVAGSVNYKGQPLSSGTINFFHEEGRSATGEVLNGEIVNVMTYLPNDGAPVGKLKVTVFSFDKSGVGVNAQGKNSLPSKSVF